MSETSPSIVAASRLGDVSLPVATSIARVAIADTTGRLVLRVAAETAARIGGAIGLALDGPINRAATSEGTAALRLGPDDWLLLADAERDPWLSARIGEAASGAPIALIDVSHRSVSLMLEGPGATAVLAAGCALPLDTEAFPVGKATRTLLAKAEIVLWRREPERFHIEVAASFAPYALALLDDAIRSEAAIAASHAP